MFSWSCISLCAWTCSIWLLHLCNTHDPVSVFTSLVDPQWLIQSQYPEAWIHTDIQPFFCKAGSESESPSRGPGPGYMLSLYRHYCISPGVSSVAARAQHATVLSGLGMLKLDHEPLEFKFSLTFCPRGTCIISRRCAFSLAFNSLIRVCSRLIGMVGSEDYSNSSVTRH